MVVSIVDGEVNTVRMRVISELVFQNQGMPEIIIVYLAGEWAFLKHHWYRGTQHLHNSLPYSHRWGCEGVLFEDMVPPASLAGACQMDG